jgi:hypothetical protein
MRLIGRFSGIDLARLRAADTIAGGSGASMRPFVPYCADQPIA